jgi:uncharacterized protein YjbI with pentapeptide repeats
MAENSDAEKIWARVREIARKTRILWWTAGAVVVAALVIVILWKVPQCQVAHYQGLASKDWFDKVNEARKTLATILGGLVLLAGGFATWWNLKLAQESLRTSQEAQITDRFTKAVEQLGSEKLPLRLGGIYALARIADESERDHWPIMEVLCTYVREYAPPIVQKSLQENQASAAPTLHEAQESTQENQASLTLPPADILAILTVLGRRDRKYEGKDQDLDLSGTYLRGANLHRANLSGAYFLSADLSRAILHRANLSGAVLASANLSGAVLASANLSGAVLVNANLSGAALWEADLSGAFLEKADLSGAYFLSADLSRAKLSGADLSGADLSRARNLTQEQVDAAKGDSATQLPENLHRPESWKK